MRRDLAGHASADPYVNHLCPHDLDGELLYPLEDLRVRAPNVYARERRKYDGREGVLDFRVPFLNVTWGHSTRSCARFR